MMSLMNKQKRSLLTCNEELTFEWQLTFECQIRFISLPHVCVINI